MLATNHVYTILLLTTSAVLFFIWIHTIQQYCISNFYDKPRLRRILSTLFYTSFSLILNILIYIIQLFPKSTISGSHSGVSLVFIECVLEAIFVIIAFHIFRTFLVWSIKQFYTPSNMPIPKWFYLFFSFIQIYVTLSVCIFYPLMILFNNQFYLLLGYILIAFAILFESLFAMYNLRKIRILFKYSTKTALIKTAKRYLCGIYVLVALICIYSILQIFMCILMLINSEWIAFNHGLGVAVTHSFILIVTSFVLLIWNYQDIKCCGCCGYLSNDSVCIVYECDAFCEFWYYLCYCYCCNWLPCWRDKIGYQLDSKQIDKQAVLLQESTMNVTRKNTTDATGNSATITKTPHTNGLYIHLLGDINTNISLQNGDGDGI